MNQPKAIGQPSDNPKDSLSAGVVVLGTTVPETAHHFLADQAIGFAHRGWQVHLVTSPGATTESLRARMLAEAADVHVHGILMSRQFSPIRDFIGAFQWIRLLRSIQPDVTFIGTPKASLLGTLAAWIVGVKRRIYLVRGLRLEGMSGPASALAWVAERVTCQLSTDILCVSDSLRQALVTRQIASPSKAIVLGSGSSNGVDTVRFTPATPDDKARTRAQFGINNHALVVGYAGRLPPDKGIAALITAMKQVHELTGAILLIAGNSDTDSPLDASILRSLNVDWIRPLGHVSDMTTFYHACDVFCLPSRREGFPNVVLEAAASGLPTVTTRATGCIDSVMDGQSGLVVDIDNSDSLANALLQFLQNDAFRGAAGRAARLHVAGKYSQSRVQELYADYVLMTN